MDSCLYFNYSGRNRTTAQNINSSLSIYRNNTAWCNYTSPNISKSSNAPLALPSGIFFICGDRAWGGIPSHIKGGPCSLGRLTLLTPNTSILFNHRRSKRSTHAFKAECRDDVEFWNSEKIIMASIAAPGVAASQALATLNKLGCWLAKQTNATSQALSSLLLNVDSVRRATLQNRAAIDFFLLAQGDGCEELDGMCCMNLSDHSESIHQSIQQLKEGVKKLQVDDGWGWMESLFSGWGISGWLKGLIKVGLILLCAICGLLLIIPCLLSCLQRALQRMVNTAFWVEKQKGGIVGFAGSVASDLEQLDIALKDRE
ncbi:uncharacterized protein LOC127028044 [Gymnogyps californianus]|uniref:uncharacterized protein LOC127028044 n=1 Tax=Gymnogyps californianus TaxID=33616 RepID=UPI0021CAC2A2|nr:uncharacterized protein LOC127028044 [Gymnogyps californianus]